MHQCSQDCRKNNHHKCLISLQLLLLYYHFHLILKYSYIKNTPHIYMVNLKGNKLVTHSNLTKETWHWTPTQLLFSFCHFVLCSDFSFPMPQSRQIPARTWGEESELGGVAEISEWSKPHPSEIIKTQVGSEVCDPWRSISKHHDLDPIWNSMCRWERSTTAQKKSSLRAAWRVNSSRMIRDWMQPWRVSVSEGTHPTPGRKPWSQELKVSMACLLKNYSLTVWH